MKTMIENPDKYKFRKIEKIYSPSRIESFKLPQKTKKPLLEINVIWQKLRSFLKKKKYDSIPRRKVALRPRRFTRSGYTVKDGSKVKSASSSHIKLYRSPTSIGLNPAGWNWKNIFKKMYFKKY